MNVNSSLVTAHLNTHCDDGSRARTRTLINDDDEEEMMIEFSSRRSLHDRTETHLRKIGLSSVHLLFLQSIRMTKTYVVLLVTF